VFDKPVDQLLFDFNLKPAEYLHDTWLSPEQSEVWRRIPADCTEAQSYLSDWALSEFGIGHRFDFDFSASEKRLLLIDPASLREVVLMIGLCCLRHKLRKHIDRADAQRLQQYLGSDTAAFFYEHILPCPPVLHMQSSCEPLSNLFVESVRAGILVLRSTLDVAAAPSADRAALKLPKMHASKSALGVATDEQRQRTLVFCIDCVVRHRLPQWHWLF
jgi:YOP proteins translocation protein K (YscK)